MLMVMMDLSSSASITHEPNNAYIDTVGDDDSSFEMYSRCGLPSAHPRPFILPFLFLFKNIKYPRAICLISHVTSASGSTSMHPLPTRFSSSSFNAAWYPSSPNSCYPLRNPYCGVDNDASISKYVCIMFAPSCCSMKVVCAALYLKFGSLTSALFDLNGRELATDISSTLEVDVLLTFPK